MENQNNYSGQELTYTGESKVIAGMVTAINYLLEHGGGGGGGGLSSVTATLYANSWSGNTAPYSYDLGNTYADKDVVVGYDASSQYSTSEKMSAAANAKIIGGDTTLLYAYGTKPTVDIPVILIYG